jgi:hypothetical protein
VDVTDLLVEGGWVGFATTGRVSSPFVFCQRVGEALVININFLICIQQLRVGNKYNTGESDLGSLVSLMQIKKFILITNASPMTYY